MTDNTSGLLEEIGILQADAANMAGEIERLTAELAASRAKVDELKRNGDELLTAFRYACKVRDAFEADTTRLLGQLADMTRRKDGWRLIALAALRECYSQYVGAEPRGTHGYWRAFDEMNEELRDKMENIKAGLPIWKVRHD